MSETAEDGEESPQGREVWIEKYRPQTLDDVGGHENITERLDHYIQQNDLPHLLFAGPAGVGKCVTGETPVVTTRGVERIDEVVGETTGFDSPPAGLEVLSYEEGAFSYRAPSHVFATTTTDLLELETRDGNRHRVTPEHQLLIASGGRLEWVAAAELTPGDRLARPHELPLPTTDRQLTPLADADDDSTLAVVSRSVADATGLGPVEPVSGRGERDLVGVRPTAVAALELPRSRLREQLHGLCSPATAGHLEPVWEFSPALGRVLGLVAATGTIDETGIRIESDSPAVLAAFERAAVELFGPAVGLTSPTEGCRAIPGRTAARLLCAGADEATGRLEPASAGVIGAPAATRRAFLRAILKTNGRQRGTELTIEGLDERVLSLVSYLLAGEGVPSRRAAVSDADEGELLVTSPRALGRLADRVGGVSTAALPTDQDPELSEPVERAAQTLIDGLGLPRQLSPAATDRAPAARLDRLVRAVDERIATAEETVAELRELLAVEPSPLERPAPPRVSTDGGHETVEAGRPMATLLDRQRRSLGVTNAALAADTSLAVETVSRALGDGPAAAPERLETIASSLLSTARSMLAPGLAEARELLGAVREETLRFDRLERVEPLSESQRVYDLTVPGARNYVAGAVPTVMHNTTSAVAIAKEIYGDAWQENFLELNASDQRGIDVVRDRIKHFARTSFGGFDYRIIFLDEADALCVPPGTGVITGDPSAPELRPIEQVARDGTAIPSVDPATNAIQADRGRLVDSGVADFFELGLADGRTVTASLSHPFFTLSATGRLVERELRELSVGDRIAEFSDAIGVARCRDCETWTVAERCERCGGKGAQGASAPEPGALTDGGVGAVETVAVERIAYSHRGTAYNITMDGTPNFMLANGVLTHNTSDAQSALRRTMEQFSNNTRFILSCNYSSRIIDPIQSRCAVFRFSQLADEAVAEQVHLIAETEGIELTEDGVEALVYAADGDMRRAINGLQAAAVLGETVDEETVFAITSTARPETIQSMVELALDGEFTAARGKLESLLVDSGIAGGDIIDQLHRSVWEFDLSERAAVQLMERLGEADYRIAAGANEQVQLEALLASVAAGPE